MNCFPIFCVLIFFTGLLQKKGMQLALTNSIFWNLTLNIGLLVLIASLLTKIELVRHMLVEKRSSMFSQVSLAIVFGLFCILSTYTGVQVDGVIVNTRVIGALAGGILGGPVVGIGAGFIGGLHRYLYGSGFTSLACAFSTLLAGIIGSIFHPHFLRGKWDEMSLFAITAFSEIVEMAMILLLSRPFDTALSIVKTIALPMIFLNSFGMLIFIATFKNVFIEKDQESASKLRLAFSIAEQCLPYLRKGLSSREDLAKAISIILSSSICSSVMITDRQQILARGQADSSLDIERFKELPLPAKQAMESNQFVTLTETRNNNTLKGVLRYHTIIAAPLTKMDQPIGCLMVFVKRRWLNLEADISFVKGLATLFSTYLELSEIDYQKSLRQRAEFSALQSQINPHFLYNSLNTVSCICRENPARARELLMTMATYFRQTLDSDRCMISLKEEMAHVNNYLALEKARFEEKLDVTVDIPEDVDCLVPTLILQPIVENAVKYGVDSHGRRRINIAARQDSGSVTISVSDSGPGFPPDILEKLHSGSSGSNRIGLSNVQKRLKSIYGEENNLQITSRPEGSQVVFMITEAKGEHSNNERRSLPNANSCD